MNTTYIDIYINDVKLPAPATMDITYSDMDAEGLRPITTGKLKRNRIRTNVQKINIGYLLNEVTDIDQIMNMIKGETLSVRLYDNAAASIVTKEMYVSEKSFSYIRVQRNIKGQGFKFTLEEV